jgi:antitoxin component YwqK of YwqJK toxin-antitoxin module
MNFPNLISVFIIICYFIFSCNSSIPDSKIEVIKYDKQQVIKIQGDYDSTFKEVLKLADFWTIDHFYKDTVEHKIMRDSLKNIVAIVKCINGIVVVGKEYYPNGQLKCKANFPPGNIDGKATYYYADGRISSLGLWKNYMRVGNWYYYNNLGKLDYTEYYNTKGELIKKD